MKKISVIFPNYNNTPATLKYLHSLRSSQYPSTALEIIMVDNNSSDHSWRKVKKFYPEVKIITLNKNYGPAYARNRGLEIARGELFFCSDNDQFLAPSTLKLLHDCLQDNPKIGVLGGQILTPPPHSQLISNGYHFNFFFGLENGINPTFPALNFCDWVAGCGMMFRRQIYQEIGGFDEKFTFFAEDADFCLRVKKAGYQVASLNKALIYHPLPKPLRSFEQYLNYYQAKFYLIQKHSPFPYKISSYFFHLTFFSWGRKLLRKPEFFSLKWRALLKVLRKKQ